MTNTAKRYSKYFAALLVVMLMFSASIPNNFSYAAEEKYSEEELKVANQTLDEFFSNKIANLITNGGTWNPENETGRLKSDDGLTYTIGYKMSTSKNPDFTALNFNLRRFTKHTATVFFEGNILSSSTAPDGSKSTIKINKRPTKEDFVINAKLALFRKGANNIKVQNKEVSPIASRDFKIILKAPKSENAPVKVDVKVFEKIQKKEISKIKDKPESLAINVYKDQERREPVYNLNGRYQYNLEKNRTYYIWVKAEGYEEYFQPVKITKAGELKIELTSKAKAKEFSRYKLKFRVKNPSGDPVDNSKIQVAEIGYYDPIDDVVTDDEPVEPASDNSYELVKGGNYKISVSAEGYTTLEGKNAFEDNNFRPTGDKEEIVLDVVLTNGKDKENPKESGKTDNNDVLNKIKDEFDQKITVLRPNYDKDKNINSYLKSTLQNRPALKNIDFKDIIVEVANTEDSNYIKKDGTINYRKGDLSRNFTANIKTSFVIKLGTDRVETSGHNVTVGWDKEYFKSKMEDESQTVTEEFLKGNQKIDFNNLDKDFSLPTVILKDKRKVWSEIQ